MKTISREEIKHIAELANLDIEGEEEKFSSLLSDTLNYIDTLSEIDTENVDPTFQVSGLKNVYQEDDKQKATLNQKEALSNAHEIIDDLFATSGVFERE